MQQARYACSLGDVGMLGELLQNLQKLHKGRNSSRKVRGAGGGEIKGLQTKLMPSAGQVGGGDAMSVLGGPYHAAAIHHLLSASLTLLSCPSCPCPLCPGATLPTPGGSGGSVNGYHTCKGELAVNTAVSRPPVPFLS